MTDSRDPKAADPQRRTLLKGTAGILATGVFPAQAASTLHAFTFAPRASSTRTTASCFDINA